MSLEIYFIRAGACSPILNGAPDVGRSAEEATHEVLAHQNQVYSNGLNGVGKRPVGAISA